MKHTTEVNTDVRPHVTFESVQVRPIQDSFPHTGEQPSEIRTAEVGACLEFGKGVNIRANTVQDNVLRGIEIEFLGEVGVDSQKLAAVVARSACCLLRLSFEG